MTFEGFLGFWQKIILFSYLHTCSRHSCYSCHNYYILYPGCCFENNQRVVVATNQDSCQIPCQISGKNSLQNSLQNSHHNLNPGSILPNMGPDFCHFFPDSRHFFPDSFHFFPFSDFPDFSHYSYCFPMIQNSEFHLEIVEKNKDIFCCLYTVC